MAPPRHFLWNDAECPNDCNLHQRKGDEPHECEYLNFVDEVSNKEAFPILSLLRALQATARFPLVLQNDANWNEDGNHFVAEMSARTLIRLGANLHRACYAVRRADRVKIGRRRSTPASHLSSETVTDASAGVAGTTHRISVRRTAYSPLRGKMNRIKTVLSITMLVVTLLAAAGCAATDNRDVAKRAPNCSVRPERPWCK